MSANATTVGIPTEIVLTGRKKNPFAEQKPSATAYLYKPGNDTYEIGKEAAFKAKASAYGKSKGWTARTSAQTKKMEDGTEVIEGVLVQFVEKAKPQTAPAEQPTEQPATV